MLVKIDVQFSFETCTMYASGQWSSLKCANAFQCEGLQNNHTSLKLFNSFATLHKQKLDNNFFVLNMKIYDVLVR